MNPPATVQYPKLTEEILGRAPEWDETRPETPQLRHTAGRHGLSIREFLLWHVMSEMKLSKPKLWWETTPPVLRDWYHAVLEVVQHGNSPTPGEELAGDLKSYRWN